MRFAIRWILALTLLLPIAAGAEPIELKLAFFSSDRTHLYLSGIKPFVDAVNAEGTGRVKIAVYFSGTLGKDLTRQSQLALGGTADIVHVVPPYERASFPDATVIELPGLFKDAREATLVSSQLIEAGIIRGFENYFVIGAFPGGPESIHTRPPVGSIADLNGKRIRISNEKEGEFLRQVGAAPVFVPLYETTHAINSGQVDGAMAPLIPMAEFGLGRVATNHFLLKTSCVLQVLMMTHSRFDSLLGDVQTIIRKYSGTWFAGNYIRNNEASSALIMNQLEADPRRKIVFPSKADTEIAESAFNSIIEAYARATLHNAELVHAAQAAVTRLRSEAR